MVLDDRSPWGSIRPVFQIRIVSRSRNPEMCRSNFDNNFDAELNLMKNLGTYSE